MMVRSWWCIGCRGSGCKLRSSALLRFLFFFFQAEDGIRDLTVTGVQTCALPIWTLSLAAGRNSKGEPLLDDKTISRSVLDGALTSTSEYLVTATGQMLDVKERQSIVAFDLRTVICMPLRKPLVQTTRGEQPGGGEVMGALYVDSRFASRDITSVSHDILRAIATEAAQLVENARLVQAEEAGRRYQQELSIAASIQQRLLAGTLPEVPFAREIGRASCRERV